MSNGLTLAGGSIVAAALLWIAAMTTGALAAESSNQNRGQNPNGSGQAQAHQGDTQRSPLNVRIIENENDAAARQKREAAAEEDRKNEKGVQNQSLKLATFGIILSALSMVAVVVTIFYTARSANAALASTTLSREALSQTIDAVKAALRSASAAEAALAQTENHFSLTQRAFVSLTQFGLGPARNTTRNDAPPSDYVMAMPSFVNRGTTPALDVRVAVRNEFVRLPHSQEEFSPNWDDIPPVLMPPGLPSATAPIFMTREQVHECLEGRGAMAIAVAIRYKDFFSDDYRYTKYYHEFVAIADWDTLMRPDNGNNGLIVRPNGHGMMT